MKFLSFIILFLTFSVANCGNFIVHGRQALQGQFPSAVYLEIFYGPYMSACTGTLLSKSFVLTAAHCLDDEEYVIDLNGDSKIFAYMGSISPPYPTKLYAKNFIIHENYRKLINDIAIIELILPALLSDTLKPATLPTSMPSPSSLVTAVGWGKTENGTVSTEQRYVTMPIIDFEECEHLIVGSPELSDKNSYVCLVGPSSEGTCSGDSGGPFYLKDTNIVIGVTSFNGYQQGKCLTDTPSVGSNVYYFLDWIHKHAKI